MGVLDVIDQLLVELVVGHFRYLLGSRSPIPFPRKRRPELIRAVPEQYWPERCILAARGPGTTGSVGRPANTPRRFACKPSLRRGTRTGSRAPGRGDAPDVASYRDLGKSSFSPYHGR